MKKALFLFIFCVSIYTIQAQQLMLEVYSGINATAYDWADYDQTEWHVPIGVRLAGGHEHVQVGVEYRKNISHPAFTSENSLSKVEFQETYKGLFLRGNFSSLPAYRFGLVLKAGAGYYETTQNSYIPPSESLEQRLDFERVLGYNAGIGISAPIYTLLHWEIGYQYNYIDHPESNINPAYKGSYHSIQMGLSLNLVFGNTAKKCRRVISGNRSKRGW